MATRRALKPYIPAEIPPDEVRRLQLHSTTSDRSALVFFRAEQPVYLFVPIRTLARLIFADWPKAA